MAPAWSRRRPVGGHADNGADRADRQQRQRVIGVVAAGRRRTRRARSSAMSRAVAPEDSPAASLRARRCWAPRGPGASIGLVGQLAAGADRDVVDHHRQLGWPRRSRPEVGLDAPPGADGCSTGVTACTPGDVAERWAASGLVRCAREWAVSLLPVLPAITGHRDGARTPRRTARQPLLIGRAPRLSPVVPATTRPSLPWSTSHRAEPPPATVAGRSAAPRSSNGVDHGGPPGRLRGGGHQLRPLARARHHGPRTSLTGTPSHGRPLRY